MISSSLYEVSSIVPNDFSLSLVPQEGHFPLLCSAGTDHLGSVEVLLRRGADPNQKSPVREIITHRITAQPRCLCCPAPSPPPAAPHPPRAALAPHSTTLCGFERPHRLRARPRRWRRCAGRPGHGRQVRPDHGISERASGDCPCPGGAGGRPQPRRQRTWTPGYLLLLLLACTRSRVSICGLVSCSVFLRRLTAGRADRTGVRCRERIRRLCGRAGPRGGGQGGDHQRALSRVDTFPPMVTFWRFGLTAHTLMPHCRSR